MRITLGDVTLATLAASIDEDNAQDMAMKQAMDEADGAEVAWPAQWAAMRDFAMESKELRAYLKKACTKAQDTLEATDGNTVYLAPLFLRWAIIGFNLAVATQEVKELERLTADIS